MLFEPVDELTITSLVDNSYDGLMVDMGPARRAAMAQTPPVDAPQFEQGETVPGLVAEHGFAALVTTRRGNETHTLLFDTGVSPNGLGDNLERLGIDSGAIEAVVLSHGHFDHAGGFPGLARLRRRQGLPITLHPLVWTRRRVAFPGRPEWQLPVLSRRSLESEGFQVIERRQPSLLLGGGVLITGEVDRTTDFETGMPFHESHGEHGWEPDPLILDDQALIVHVRNRGLVVLTGCGHAGAVNICHYARRLTGVLPAGRVVRRVPPDRPRLRTDHRTDGGSVAPARPTDRRARTLHRLAGAAPSRCRTARRFHPQRGREPRSPSPRPDPGTPGAGIGTERSHGLPRHYGSTIIGRGNRRTSAGYAASARDLAVVTTSCCWAWQLGAGDTAVGSVGGLRIELAGV